MSEKHHELRIDHVDVAAFTIPTGLPESDGTLEWHSTTLVTVDATCGETNGFGYTYADTATARLIKDLLVPLVRGRDPMDVTATWQAMRNAVRNLGGPGISAMAISAVDTALWDLKGKLLNVPLVLLLGRVRDALPIYGSGGFTSYTDLQLRRQMCGWANQGIPRVKMKVGRDPQRDLHRVGVTREAIGPSTELFVDANSAYDRKQALWYMEQFAEMDVTWMEQPLPP
ncbi:MAG TPA: enolase C-terminal domain-like protein, partial [Verrucomicrobiae bacterium]|nr:enolase C-terminal domain-like protein [Verrucomicrobiae bacterium]